MYKEIDEIRDEGGRQTEEERSWIGVKSERLIKNDETPSNKTICKKV